ncbi:MAG: hypothetical protein KKD17_00790 [Nanoarchaeota archaeon]|nr:hypothetical protein [Nanoarchaeota archaeon]
MKQITIILMSAILVSILIAGCTTQTTEIEEYNPAIDPADFVSVVDNPYYTLTPGLTYTYESETDEGLEKNIVIVTDKTKEILGVTNIEVWDRVWLDDELIEETFDWYAQDKEGNVWYFGEDSKEYENGEVTSTHGSWEAGVDGAKPGTIMEAHPKVGDSYRQEFYKGEAEDMADVLSLDESVSVAYGSFENCIKTYDWSAIDPALKEHKYYCAEAGNVVLETVVDSDERVELIDLQK